MLVTPRCRNNTQACLRQNLVPHPLIVVYDGFQISTHISWLEGTVYRLTRDLSTRELVSRHAPTLGASMLIAELFYKFGSFTLECLAFLATWYVIDAAAGAVIDRLPRREPISSD